MKRAAILLVTVGLVAAGRLWADYGVSFEGAWPETWPKELEPLRKTSGTIQGGLLDLVTHHVAFTDRKEFETAWPHFLKVKSKGAPLILLRSPSKHWHFGETRAGLLIHSPATLPKDPAPLTRTGTVRERWIHAVYFELVVDGDIVDLNRIRLPADTPIVDERFDEVKTESAAE